MRFIRNKRSAEELIVIGKEGSARIEFDGKTAELTNDQVIYLQPGTKRSVKAGPKGFKAFEVYSPVRLDHLALAGQKTDGVSATFPDQNVTPSLQPGVVVSVTDIPWTPLTNPEEGKSYRRGSALSRLIWGKNAQVSLVRMDPGTEFPLHIHPEDQLTHTLRGTLNQGVLDQSFAFSGTAGNTIFLPSGMVHSAKLGETGADQLDVFWPVRPDYIERCAKAAGAFPANHCPRCKTAKARRRFHLHRRAHLVEGQAVFFRHVFQEPAAGDYTGSPARSRLIVMEPSGKWRVLSSGMQSNGTIATQNGNLIVCDMFGHRVVELEPSSGRVVGVILDKINGKPIDGPNDLVMDAKGGIYVTDPQFTPEAQKSQPGKQVYYVAPDGTAKVVIGPGEYAMPNGVELSPDGKTLYVNNTWQKPGENFVWAYDVAADGSLSKKRQFAKLDLTPAVLEAPKPEDRLASGADGSAVDNDGRYYVATTAGVQIFMPDGTYVGTIWLPQSPVSITFGGANNDILYMVGSSTVWSIQTKAHGFRLPPNMN
jgi:gluconolactonase